MRTMRRSVKMSKNKERVCSICGRRFFSSISDVCSLNKCKSAYQKAYQEAYYLKNKDKYKAYQKSDRYKAYKKSDKYKAYLKSDKYKAYKKAYKKIP